MAKMSLKKEWVTANEAHYIKGVTRAWLRAHWDGGSGPIRKRCISGESYDGTLYTRYLYNLADIEKLLKAQANKEGGEAW